MGRVSFAPDGSSGHMIDMLEAQLRDFYFVFAPERIEYAAEVAAAYCDDVDALNDALNLRYGFCLFRYSSTASTLPTADVPTNHPLLRVHPIFPSGDGTATDGISSSSGPRSSTTADTNTMTQLLLQSRISSAVGYGGGSVPVEIFSSNGPRSSVELVNSTNPQNAAPQVQPSQLTLSSEQEPPADSCGESQIFAGGGGILQDAHADAALVFLFSLSC